MYYCKIFVISSKLSLIKNKESDKKLFNCANILHVHFFIYFAQCKLYDLMRCVLPCNTSNQQWTPLTSAHPAIYMYMNRVIKRNKKPLIVVSKTQLA